MALFCKDDHDDDHDDADDHDDTHKNAILLSSLLLLCTLFVITVISNYIILSYFDHDTP